MKRVVMPPERRETFWVDVLDHMPDDETTVLVASGCGESDVNMAWHADGVWRDCGTAAVIIDVTHWMDIPEGPTARRNDQAHP
jgi:hypothetical protein